MTELRTARLILRFPRESDHAAMTAFGQSDRNRFVGGPLDASGAWRALLAGIGHWTLRGYGFFSVDEAATGTMVGRVGVICHHGWPEPELAWHLYDGFEGKGYATEAAEAARTWYYTTRSTDPLISQVAPDNDASARVCQRLGCHIERRDELLGHPVDIWRHPGPEAAV